VPRAASAPSSSGEPAGRVTAPAATSFTFEPAFAVAAALAAVVYLRAARRAAVPGWRRASFLAGMVLMAAPLNSPLETIAVHYLLLGHLVQNALIADLAPPLALLGLTAGMGAAILRRLGPTGRLLQSGFGWPLWVVGWYGTHLARPYTYALEHPLALDAEHAFLILIGLCFWWPVVVPGPRRMGSASPSSTCSGPSSPPRSSASPTPSSRRRSTPTTSTPRGSGASRRPATRTSAECS